jgi:hypothetical protein
MPKDPREFAELLGAKIVGEVPDVGGGPFGMARLAHLMHQRLTPGQGERPGRPTDSIWVCRPKVPMSAATRRRLVEIAEAMSTPQRRVSPMQVAAQLLEEAVARLTPDAGTSGAGSERDAQGPTTADEVVVTPAPQTGSRDAKRPPKGKGTSSGVKSGGQKETRTGRRRRTQAT